MFHRGTLRLLALASLVLALAASPSPAMADGPVKINNLSYERDRHSLVLDITGPVTISTRSLRAPARLVVDIPVSTLLSHNKELTVNDDLVKRVRVSQFQIFPPTVRVVIETATATEPLIAVQQTHEHLYITLAPARQGEPASPAASPAAMAKPSPMPSAHSMPSPTVRPSAKPSTVPSVAPSPKGSPWFTGKKPTSPTPSHTAALPSLAPPHPRPLPSLAHLVTKPTPSPSPAATLKPVASHSTAPEVRLTPEVKASPIAEVHPVTVHKLPHPSPTPRLVIHRGAHSGEEDLETLPGQ
jgi:hypothetical protein